MGFTRSAVIVAGLVVAVAAFRPTPVETQSPLVRSLEERVAALESQIAAFQSQVSALQAADVTLQADIDQEATDRIAGDATLQQNINNVSVPQNLMDLADYVSVNVNTINDLGGPHIIFTGANVHIQNGTGSTPVYSGSGTMNGLGNLILGYNEAPQDPFPPAVRTGSHNLVVGPWHTYSGAGGFVAGHSNSVTADFASVSGGFSNTASADNASVSGGAYNMTSADSASVSGGTYNTASEIGSSVSGGTGNTASGNFASVSGGYVNTASHSLSTVSGGVGQTTTADFQHVP